MMRLNLLFCLGSMVLDILILTDLMVRLLNPARPRSDWGSDGAGGEGRVGDDYDTILRCEGGLLRSLE